MATVSNARLLKMYVFCNTHCKRSWKLTGDDNVRPVEDGRGDSVAPIGPGIAEPSVFDGEVLTDFENEYVSRWLAHADAKTAVERRKPAQVARRRVALARQSVARTAVAGWRADQVARVRSVLAYRVRQGPTGRAAG